MKLLNDPSLRAQFDALIEQYAELLVGDNAPETVEQVKLWALYSHIHKTMPALANHWNAAHPEGKAAVRELFEDVKARNQRKAAASPPPTST
ncbi:YusU family protein [Paenibacillus sp.]|uniref:YusU family protein n=1 Tax=Paenibacillus sp. TaxID=58172 RepID=UPI002D50DDAB|nr:YusU family protein [Paenibacillus sp.]HZG84664.1 YusU family protein [Paenibacillus sp.]